MAKQMNFDQIMEQLAGLEDKIRTELVRDILSELRDFAKTGTDEEAPGFQAAIEVIENNFISA